ncbi:D-alanyl-D-alanine carboxypeptidase [Arsenicitalea aurantiaca]|uniref:D-alanyl-D-alanine carboxypeptidase n=1 Tax=Arsenicitalea aurantiaca TaxID=1783274 RepID=A0A433X5V3_9HYPH|nr:D-alanyl-D-alanine carboxypeptidase family protein [Arsenicitalea aurantiaca]RUT29417.1 D-alanyl-D-alanine carboxypeptidase [Arsenicitalea aurantiaca]
MLQIVRRFLVAMAASVLLFVPFQVAQANPMLLVDAANGQVLHAEDAGVPWHPASLTKMMTAYVAFTAVAQGRVSLDTPVVLSAKAVAQPPSKSGLPADSALSLKDALYLLLVKSANDIAVAIGETVSGSEAAFVGEMNATAQTLGMSASRFVNPHGLHHAEQVTTARDMAVLALYIRQNFPQYLPMFGTGEVTVGNVRHESQNALLKAFNGTTGMKTGYVCASGLNIVATIERQGRSLLAVVLGGSSGRERNEMTAELFLKGLSGATRPTGEHIVNLANAVGTAPRNMRPLICGKDAQAYVAERERAYPMGLPGQPSFLIDEVATARYAATDLGRVRNVPLPRPRPAFLPQMQMAVASGAGMGAAAPRSEPAAGPVRSGLVAPVPRPRLVR